MYHMVGTLNFCCCALYLINFCNTRLKRSNTLPKTQGDCSAQLIELSCTYLRNYLSQMNLRQQTIFAHMFCPLSIVSQHRFLTTFQDKVTTHVSTLSKPSVENSWTGNGQYFIMLLVTLQHVETTNISLR